MESFKPTKTTDYVTLYETTSGPNLPEKLADHCLVSLNETIILLIGGNTGNDQITISSKTYFYNLKEQIWSNGKQHSNIFSIYVHQIFFNSLSRTRFQELTFKN
jgi:hypothetical protein